MRILPIIAACVVAANANSAVVVHVDFTTDSGNGAGGSANGTADWIDNLAALSTAAGIDAFTADERATIESNILAALNKQYSDFDVTFQRSASGRTERLTFGAYTSIEGELGVAPRDFMNLADTDGSDATSARVYTKNFHFIVEADEDDATQVAELSAALAGTGGHEVGHVLGLFHHHAYGRDDIDPSNYANTGGAQNNHLIATGSTGLQETGRESPRTISRMSALILESAASHPFLRNAVRAIGSTTLELTNTTGAVGATAGTATALSLTSLPVSGLDAANTIGFLDNSSDVDVYSFTVSDASSVWVETWSSRRWLDSLNTKLRLLDTDGSTVLASNDDIRYSGNVFDAGTIRSTDSALWNIKLPSAGTYFVEVKGDESGFYNLIFGTHLDNVAAAKPTTGMAPSLGSPRFLAESP